MVEEGQEGNILEMRSQGFGAGRRAVAAPDLSLRRLRVLPEGEAQPGAVADELSGDTWRQLHQRGGARRGSVAAPQRREIAGGVGAPVRNAEKDTIFERSRSLKAKSVGDGNLFRALWRAVGS